MHELRGKIVKAIQADFPAMKDSIIPFKGFLDSESDKEISYNAPGVLVAIIDCIEAPPDKDPWPLQANFAAVVVVREPTTALRDEEGWKLAMRVAKTIWRNCWGYQRKIQVTPAVITSITKNIQRDGSGVPTGLDYWVITFSNLVETDVAIGLV